MKNLLFFLCVFFTSVFASAQTDLFISEYVEGTGNNKAIEIYNPTSDAIDLNNYWVIRFSNGSYVFTEGGLTHLSGTIQSYQTFVLVNGQTTSTPTSPACSPVLQAMADQLDGAYPAPMYMNGNDAIGLIKTPNGEYPNADMSNVTGVDLIGQIGLGSAISGETGWSYVQDSTLTYYNSSGILVTGKVINYIVQSKATDGVSYGPFWMSWTSDHSLIRKPNVIQGVVVNPSPFVVKQQWDTVPAQLDTATGFFSYKDIWDNLGSHTCVAGVVSDFSANVTSLCQGEMVTFTFNVSGYNADSVLWEFPGGNPSNSINPEPVIEYALTGDYDVTLMVFVNNNPVTVTKQNYIHVQTVPAIPAKPAGNTIVCFNEVFSDYATNTTSTIWDLTPPSAGTMNFFDNICRIYWDETFSEQASLKVKAFSNCGNSEYSEILSIEKTNPPAIIFAEDILVCYGESKLLEPQISGGMPPFTYFWQPVTLFNDSTSATPIITPLISSDIFLTLTDNLGCTEIQNFLVTVEGNNYNLNFTGFPHQFITPPFTVQFDNLTPDLENYDFNWYFGNGDSSDVAEPTYTYTSNGIYSVTLVAISKATGCSDTFIKEDYVDCSGASIGDATQDGFRYFVDEDNQTLNLSFENQPENLQFNLFDLYGKVHSSAAISQKEYSVTLHGLAAGIYFFVLRKEGYVTGGKIILTK